MGLNHGLHGAIGPQNEEAGGIGTPGHIRQPFQRGAIAPVQIFQHQDKTLLNRQNLQNPRCFPQHPLSRGAGQLPLQVLSREEVAFPYTADLEFVDPERDDPERLRQYVGYFHPEILGLTGTPRHIAAVAARYGVAYRRAPEESALGYLVDHSAYTYLIDRQGRLRETLDHATASERIVKRVRHYLAEAVPTDAGAAPDATIPR